MSEISARASRRAFCFGSCTRNGFTARSGPVLRCNGGPPAAGATGGAAAGGAAAGGAGAGAGAGRGDAAGADTGDAGGAARGAGAETGGATGGRGGVAGGAGVGRRAGGGAAGGGRGAGGVRGAVLAGVKTGAAAGVTAAPAGALAIAGRGAAADVPVALPTAKTLLHTAQRARTPPAGTLAGSTRYTVSHDGQETFTSRPRYRVSPSPGSGSWRRSTTYTEPGWV